MLDDGCVLFSSTRVARPALLLRCCCALPTAGDRRPGGRPETTDRAAESSRASGSLISGNTYLKTRGIQYTHRKSRRRGGGEEFETLQRQYRLSSLAMIRSTLIAALLVWRSAESFTAPATARCSSVLASTVEAESTTVGEPVQPLLERDRYVATNRFEVRSGRAAKFEKRW